LEEKSKTIKIKFLLKVWYRILAGLEVE
jgi:hypothetical protein